MNFENFGKRIKKKREELHLTQEQLAEKLDISSTYVSAIERAASKCSVDTLYKLSETLDVSADYLLFGITDTNCNTAFSKILESLSKDNKQLYINLCEAIAETLK